MRYAFGVLKGLLWAQLGYLPEVYSGFSADLGDSLLGSLNRYRLYDVTFYDLQLSIDPENKKIAGSNTISFWALADIETLQVDLVSAYKVRDMLFEGKKVPFWRVRDTRAIWVKLPYRLERKKYRLQVFYEGTPRRAPMPPWDGGFVWKEDSLGRPWFGVACQGIGASLWWPLKDHLSDEPDSMRMTFCVPAPLKIISNGTLQKVTSSSKENCFTYVVHYPINTYNVTLYGGMYETVEDTLQRSDGSVLKLRYHLLQPAQKASFAYLSRHAKKVLRAFEKYFGSYPASGDGFGLVESPYYGMEHQNVIAYGNEFKEDKTWQMDYIILHETGHEWWGNHIGCADNSDLWLNEGFCTYAEAVYIENYFGYEKAVRYLKDKRPLIRNARPLLGPRGVNFSQTFNTDIYYKGAWILHTLRSMVNNDSLWWGFLRAMQDSFSFRQFLTEDLIAFSNRHLPGRDWTSFWQVYLGYRMPPSLQIGIQRNAMGEKEILLSWKVPVKNFRYPVEIKVGDKILRAEVSAGEITRLPYPAGVEGMPKPYTDRFYVFSTALSP
ncbi:MAG: M1 family metallopeptidase [Bacteroidia bacterium]